MDSDCERLKRNEVKNNRIIQAAADLFPGYFAFVMATGIISTATFQLGMRWLAWALLACLVFLAVNRMF